MDFPPRPGSSRPRREARQSEQEPLPVEPEPADAGETGEYEPAAEPEAPRRRGGRRSETVARVLWAIPWIVFAVVIVAAGGPIFAVAMVGLAWAAQIELFRMTARSRPFEAAAFLGTAGMIAAA
jgi:hypothetical protein